MIWSSREFLPYTAILYGHVQRFSPYMATLRDHVQQFFLWTGKTVAETVKEA